MIADFALDPAADDQVLLAQVVNYYHDTLKTNPEALDYLRRRGITNIHVLDHFRIGYADRSLGLKLPTKASKAGRAIRSRLQQVGLYRESGHEHFRGSVTFPILASDGSGRIVDIYGRKMLGERLRPGTPIHTHLHDKQEGVWNIEAFASNDEIILCAGLWDALTLWNHGYRNGTTVFSPEALTADLVAALTEFSIKRVLTPCETLTAPLIEAGLEAFLVKLPLNLDINAFALQAANPVDALGDLLRHAEWIGRGTPSAVSVPFEPDPAASPTIAPFFACDEAEDDLDALSGDDDDPETDELPSQADHGDAELPPLRTASPVPMPPVENEPEVSDDEVTMTFGNRRYRVRGLKKNSTLDVLKVNLLVSNGVGVHVDSFDFYSAKNRKAFQDQAALELHVEVEVIKRDLGRFLLQLEEVQDRHLQALLAPKDMPPEMDQTEQAQSLDLLQDPCLLDRVLADFQVVGERGNKLIGYLAAVSRHLDQPLAVIIQSTSAAGKTTLMEAILAFMPPEQVIKYSALTGQSLYYLADGSLKHKILAIVEEEGAQRASYALKLLQSEGELRIASTGKEVSTGRLVTQEYRVEGPVMIFLTTTSIQVDEELLNRCLVLTVDEDREQTMLIHQLQRRRETLPGQLEVQQRQETLKRHRNAQRLLRPLLVANPYAEQLTFCDYKTRTRRIIRSI